MTRNPSFLQSLVAEKILREDELHKLSLNLTRMPMKFSCTW